MKFIANAASKNNGTRCGKADTGSVLFQAVNFDFYAQLNHIEHRGPYRMKKKQGLKQIFFLIFFLFSCVSHAQENTAFWTLVLAGENLTNPVLHGQQIYTFSTDKALNCFSTNGSFLWRRNVKISSKVFLHVSPAGIVYLIEKKGGTVHSFSAQGLPLHSYVLRSDIFFPPVCTKDGRVLFIAKNKLFCVTAQGNTLWTLSLSSPPIFVPANMGGDDFLLITKNGYAYRISIFGEILHKQKIKGRVSALASIADGFIISTKDGVLARYKYNESAPVWKITETPCTAILAVGNFIYYLSKDGRITCRSAEGYKQIYSFVAATQFTQSVFCKVQGDELLVSDTGIAFTITKDGKIKWMQHMYDTAFTPVITENGLVVSAGGWIINAYRAEAKIISQKAQKFMPLGNFSILTKYNSLIPFSAQYFSTKEFFEEIEKALQSGTVGVKEAQYARQLCTILKNASVAEYYPKTFTVDERAQAALLLGKLGSYEYRDILIFELQKTSDSRLAEGILRALATIEYDFDGKTFETIQMIINRFKGSNTAVMAAACQALFSIIKTAPKDIVQKAGGELFRIAEETPNSDVRKQARMLIDTLME